MSNRESTGATIRGASCPKCGFAWSSHAPHPQHPSDPEWRMCPQRSVRSYDVTELVRFDERPDGSVEVNPW